MFQQPQKGFTLIELLTVFTVIIVMTIAFVPLLRGGEQTFALERSVYALAQDMRATMQFALGTRDHVCGGGAIEGYGMYINPSTPECYIIYAQCGGNLRYQGVLCDGSGTPGVDEIITNHIFEGGVRIQSANPMQAGALNIVFLPPEPITSINDNAAQTLGTIVLELENDPSQTKTLRINTKGMIDID